MKNRIEQKIQNGYSLDLGKLIDDSFNYFKKTYLIGGLSLILISIVILFFYFTILGLIFGFGNFTDTLIQFGSNSSKPFFVIGNVIITSLFSAIMAPLTAGFINLNHLAKNNQEINLANVFDFFKSVFFKDIFKAFLIIGLVNSIVGSISLLNPENIGLSLLTGIFSGIVALVTIFVIPLIIYGKQNFSNAISKSISLFIKQPFYILIALLIAVIGSFLGFIALCIGIFFTLPYIYSMHYAIYEQAIGFDENFQNDVAEME